MSMKQIGTAVLNPGTDDETWGICESAEVSPEAEKKEINNGEGDTVGLLYTNCGKIKFSGTFTPLAGQTGTPVTDDDLIGSELQIGDKKYYIDSATFSRKKGDVSEFKIEGYYYPKIQSAGA